MHLQKRRIYNKFARGSNESIHFLKECFHKVLFKIQCLFGVLLLLERLGQIVCFSDQVASKCASHMKISP